jgi:hypothetical protein
LAVLRPYLFIKILTACVFNLLPNAFSPAVRRVDGTARRFSLAAAANNGQVEPKRSVDQLK